MKNPLLAMPLLMLTACATTSDVKTSKAGDTANQNRKMLRTSDCVFQSTITGFDALDNRYVILYGSGGRNAYLAEISAACFDVKNQPTLAAIDGDGNGQICGFGRDSIAYRDFGRLEQCRILSLEQLSDLRRYEVLGEGPPAAKDKKDKKDKDDKEDEDDDDGE